MTLWFDVTSLLSWNRPVTGVTRVELECARVFLDDPALGVRFIRFDSRSKQFSECMADSLRERLTYLETLEGRPGGKLRGLLKKILAKLPDRTQTCLLKALAAPALWLREGRGLFGAKGAEAPFGGLLKDGDTFMTVGFDLGSDQFGVLADLRAEIRVKVLSCCHDLIPWVRPDLTLDRITRAFVRYLNELVSVSDHVVCDSECTSRDLARYLEDSAHSPSHSVIRLGSRMGRPESFAPSSSLERILSAPFILYVSTLERRKNHVILLDAYRMLLDQGIENLPQLVIVGMRGWGAERFFEKLEADQELANVTTLLHHVSDTDLSLLYQNTLFTVYPSLYEGWGLPVAETLAYGQFCIASDAASIPEVGGDLVRYCPPENAEAWSRAIHECLIHPEVVEAAKARIRRDYLPPEWRDTVAQILNAAATLRQNAS